MSANIPFEADRHRVDLGAVQLEVEEHGSGEPVLLIHAALLAIGSARFWRRATYVSGIGSSAIMASASRAAREQPLR